MVDFDMPRGNASNIPSLPSFSITEKHLLTTSVNEPAVNGSQIMAMDIQSNEQEHVPKKTSTPIIEQAISQSSISCSAKDHFADGYSSTSNNTASEGNFNMYFFSFILGRNFVELPWLKLIAKYVT